MKLFMTLCTKVVQIMILSLEILVIEDDFISMCHLVIIYLRLCWLFRYFSNYSSLKLIQKIIELEK